VERIVNLSDGALVRMRGDYQRLNESFETSFAFRFGRGSGFCAEMLGLIKNMMNCLHFRTRLCLSRGGRPTGVGVVTGFADYFEPIFPEVDLGPFNALNMSTVRGSGRLPILRRGVSRLLGTVGGASLYMMDDEGALPVPAVLAVPELGIEAEYRDACALLVRLVWVYRPAVRDEVSGIVLDLMLPNSYVSVHVRRGDKNSESPYIAVDRYVAAIDRVRPEGGVVALASDDADAANELAALLPSRFQVVRCSTSDGRGFRRDEFNRLPPAERFRHVKRFLGELEVLRGGTLFVGSTGSNVTYLIEMMKAGQGVVRVERD
jgi:hypothetical protein